MLVVSALRDLRKRLVPPYQGRARLRQGIVWFALPRGFGESISGCGSGDRMSWGIACPHMSAC